jgi:hypothetical protein
MFVCGWHYGKMDGNTSQVLNSFAGGIFVKDGNVYTEIVLQFSFG